ncbi:MULTISPECIES: hypothetical protein [unclassified Streptomyces]|uniref:hypothetical protein n=1 Tax=unclassified Streptomyces TaxID=2593676 RepID=UPI002E8186E8|nr:hypothetical protein [Streptomyces sp. NBC_00589]WTI34526.1 hypothetical protein OIC96_05735 [Streptomyces sp. NBC_00775]WUB31802.1 hypothetical protein OHA51_43995 [Streptomyces sp. NBC_00589]
MHDISTSRRAIEFLLGLIGSDDAERVRGRIGLPEPDADERTHNRRVLYSVWKSIALPSSVLLWALEEDDPERNVVVWGHKSADDAMRRAVMLGVPHGPGRTHAVRVDKVLRHEPELPVPRHFSTYGLIGALRASTSMGPARSAASMVLGRRGWQAVADADRERPLPGYARWALTVRPDCPPALRARFGSHAKFTHRVRQAGVIDGPAQYATAWSPASRVLTVLFLGVTLFPTRVGEAEDALRPLVRDHLGDREDAWAVLGQLIGTFQGSVPELVITAGAIA